MLPVTVLTLARVAALDENVCVMRNIRVRLIVDLSVIIR